MKKIVLSAATIAAVAGMLGGVSAFAATTSSANASPRAIERSERPALRARVRPATTSTVVKKARPVAPKMFKAPHAKKK